MIDAQGQPKTIEFNCRFGDPETQPILSRLNSDLVTLINAALIGQLDQTEVQWHSETAVAVVLAAEGYPQAPVKGNQITGIEQAEKTTYVFHAGTALNQQGELISAGGRVLSVVGMGEDIITARQKAYHAVTQIHFDGMQYRQDIGHQALKHTVEN